MTDQPFTIEELRAAVLALGAEHIGADVPAPFLIGVLIAIAETARTGLDRVDYDTMHSGYLECLGIMTGWDEHLTAQAWSRNVNDRLAFCAIEFASATHGDGAVLVAGVGPAVAAASNLFALINQEMSPKQMINILDVARDNIKKAFRAIADARLLVKRTTIN